MAHYCYYTDGAASQRKINGDYTRLAGGWAFVRIKDDKIDEIEKGGSPISTNQEMELYAILSAIRNFYSLGESNSTIEICTDSAYSISIYTDWIMNWEKNDWTRGKTHNPIVNVEIIKATWKIIKDLKSRWGIKVKWTKVMGHSGDKYNELADKYAVEGKLYSQKFLEVVEYKEDGLLKSKFEKK